MCPQSDKHPKVVDKNNALGDDAGFLSGLGIEVEVVKKPVIEKPEPQEIPVETPPEEKKTKRTTKKTEPSLATPVVVKKEPSASVQKSKKEVDELIEKKSAQETSTQYIKPSFGGARTGGPAPRRSRTTPRRPARNPEAGGSDHQNTIRIGATRKNAVPGAQVEKKSKTYKVSDSLKKKATITVGDSITVKEFSEKMGVPLPEVMKVLMSNKILIAAQASIDFDTVSLIAQEFEVTVEREGVQVNVEDILEGNLQAILNQDRDADDFQLRPPVVTIMGHVDHGKTKLLDYLRKTNVVAGEAGGITQSIGASQIIHNDQKITFIDTPGHALFTSLRARGAKITNIVVIVVAADDGVKPQTVEAINHAKDAGVPIIVALTKIDLGINNLDEIKGKLAEQGLQPEEWGGDVMIIPLSSVTGQGVSDLLDAILLQYEMLELKYSPSRSAVGVVVEAQKDAKQGVTTSLLIMTGTLHVGDIIVVHNTYGKVRRMMNWKGEQIKTATGGDPVMILGIQDLPEPGRVAEVVASEKEAAKKIAAIQAHEQKFSKEAILQNIMDKIGKGDKVQLKIILKADSFGSLEAIKQASQRIVMPENVELKLIQCDVGSITDSDLVFAQAAQALLVGFNVGASAGLKKKGGNLGVKIKEYDIIYEYIEYIDKLAQGMIELEDVEVALGKLEVLGVFYKKGKEQIFGGKVLEGKVVNGAKFRVFRPDGEKDEEGNMIPYAIGTVTSLQKNKDNVKEVKEGHECGMKTRVSKKIEVGDIVEYYAIEKQ